MATSIPSQKGKRKIEAIRVRLEDHGPKSKRVMDSSQDDSYYHVYVDDDEVKTRVSLPKTRIVYGGTSSKSKLPSKHVKSRNLSSTMCEICADEKLTDDMFRVLGCNHSLCRVCAAKYVGSKLQDNISGINCPFTGCKGLLEPQHCRSILPKQVFDRWSDALCEALVLESEKFYCPFKDCSALLMDERSGTNEVIRESECPHCNRLFCAKCKVPWHSGAKCSKFRKLESDKRSHEDIMLVGQEKEMDKVSKVQVLC